MAYVGCLLGCIIENRLYKAEESSAYNPGLIYKSIDAGISLLPMLPMMAGSFLVSKQASFAFQLTFRYFLPPVVTNMYLFAFSEAVARKVNS